jgi:hypothetical protein
MTSNRPVPDQLQVGVHLPQVDLDGSGLSAGRLPLPKITSIGVRPALP